MALILSGDSTYAEQADVDAIEAKDKGFATAWVTTTEVADDGTILDSYNVSTLTKLGTGYYTINFTTPMDNTNYNVVGNAIGDNAHRSVVVQRGTKTVNGFNVKSLQVSGVAAGDGFGLAVFGGKV